jgi:hypothetical protein
MCVCVAVDESLSVGVKASTDILGLTLIMVKTDYITPSHPSFSHFIHLYLYLHHHAPSPSLVWQHPGRAKRRAGPLGASSVSRVVAVTGFGKCVEVEVEGANTGSAAAAVPAFSFSYGPLWAAAVPPDPAFRHLFMTGGDDRWLCLWNNW